MANNIKGITIEIGGDTTKLDKALKDVNKESRSLQSELNEVNKGLKLDPKNTELIAQKQQILKEAVGETNEKLKILKEAEQQAADQVKSGDLGEDQYRALQREIVATESNLENLKKQAEETGTTWTTVGTKIQDAGGKISDIGTKMSAVSAAIAGVATASVGAAMDLDNGYDTVLTKTGATGDALDGLTDQMNDIFTSIPTDAETAGTAIGEVNTRFGLTGDSLGTLSKQFVEFANINGTDLNTSIDSVDSIMTKFGVDSKDTASVLGLMTKAGQNTGISMDTLYSALESNGGTLKEMGLGLTQSVNLLAQFESSGVDSATALAALKKAQQNATADGKTLDDALKSNIEKIKGAKTETAALQTATELFGKKGAVEMTQAIREGRLNLNDLTGSLGDYKTTVEDTYNATLDPWDQLTVATNNLKVSGAQLASTLLTELQPVIDGAVAKVKEFTTWFGNLDEAQKKQIIKIAAIVAAIGPALVIAGKGITLIGTISKAIPAVSGAIMKLIPAMSGASAASAGLGTSMIAVAAPVVAVIAVIALLIAAFKHLWDTNAEFRTNIIAIWTEIKTNFDNFVAGITQRLNAVGINFESVTAAIKVIWQGFCDILAPVFEGAFQAVSVILSTVFNVLTGILDVFIGIFTGNWDQAWTGIKEIFSGIVNGIIGIFTNLWNTLAGILNVILGFFGTNLASVEALFMQVPAFFAEIFTAAYNGITGIFGSIGQWFAARWQDITLIFSVVSSFFSGVFTSAVSAIKTAFDSIPAFFASLWNRIVALFVGAGQTVADGVAGAFKAAINSVFGTVEGIVNGFVDAINGVLGIINNIPGVNIGKLGGISLPRLAKGGVVSSGSAIFAEAGPELLTMVNGKAVVTPLSGSAQNTSVQQAAAGGFQQNNYYTSPKALSPYECARQTRIATRNMIMQLQKGGA